MNDNAPSTKTVVPPGAFSLKGGRSPNQFMNIKQTDSLSLNQEPETKPDEAPWTPLQPPPPMIQIDNLKLDDENQWVPFYWLLHTIGRSPACGDRWRKKGWINTITVSGRLFVTQEEIKRFNAIPEIAALASQAAELKFRKRLARKMAKLDPNHPSFRKSEPRKRKAFQLTAEQRSALHDECLWAALAVVSAKYRLGIA